MSLFKKKNKTPNLYLLLDDACARAKETNKKFFYYALYDSEFELAQQWCNSKNAYIELNHIVNGNKVYRINI